MDSLQSSELFISEYQIIFWTLFAAVIAVFIPFIIYLLQRRKDKKRLVSKFISGKWLDARFLTYNLFKEGRPDTKYVHREEIENFILERIANKKNVVLTGAPLRGKTRIMLECLKQLKNTYILIPLPDNYNIEIEFPKIQLIRKNTKIVIFNDLQKFFEPGKDPIRLIDNIIKKEWLVVANCRTIEEWKTVKNIWGISSNILETIEIPEADDDFAQKVADLNNITIPKHYDRKNIGTLFVDLDEMRLRYDFKINQTQKQILIAIKKLFLTGFSNSKGEISLGSIKKLIALIPCQLSDKEWLDNMQSLIEKLFVSGSPLFIIPELVIFERIVEPNLTISEIITSVRQAFPETHFNFNKLVYSAETPLKPFAIIQEFQKAGIKLDTYQYNILIAKQDSIEEGRNLLSKMLENRISPDVVTYNILINLSKNYKEAIALKNEMINNRITPNVFIYTSLMNLSKNFNEAIALKDEMINKRITPNVYTYTSLINLSKELKDAIALQDEMKRKGIRPNIVTYNMLINLSKDFKEAIAFKDEMINKRITPDVYTYTSLINLSKELKDAIALQDEMKRKGIRPDVVTYNTMIKLSKDFKEATDLKNEMVRKGVKPDVVTFNSLIEKVETESDLISWITEFCMTKLIPDYYTTNGLNKFYPLLSESLKLNEMLSKIIVFNPLMFFTWLSNFNKNIVNQFISEYPREVRASDYIILGFANFFLHHDESNTAKYFLDSCQIHNYHYYKYLGDYWRLLKNPYKSEENFKKAIELSENQMHRSKILIRLASLIKDFKLNNKIDEAIKYCKQAISFQPDNSPEAKLLLAFFTIEFNSIENLEKKINEIKSHYCIGKRTIKETLKEINDKAKINWFNENL